MERNIVAVDDSATMRQMLKIILKDANLPVQIVSSGAEALKVIGPTTVLVITDHNMPEMSGLDLIKAIRGGAVNKRVPCIMLTTETDPDLVKEARAIGVNAWFTKPFDKVELLEAVNKFSAGARF